MPDGLRFGLARLATLLLLALSIPQAVQAQDNMQRIEARAAEVVAALRQEKPVEEVFNTAFLTAVPEAQLRALTTQLTGQFGPLQGVEQVEPVGDAGGARLVLRFERALCEGQIQLEPGPPYKVSGFRITGFTPIGDSAEAVLQDIAALPGTAGIYFGPLDGSEPILAQEVDRPFAIGSTFKLYVLSALARSIAAREHRWDEVVPLERKSLPSGVLQDWPDGSPLTLHTLALQMISISDNTATDVLIRALGRQAVEAELAASGHSHPARNRPFLTTRELFTIKAGDDTHLQAYRDADEGERRSLLDDLADSTVTVDDVQRVFSAGPRALDVEWFASPRDIARIYARLVELEDETALAILAVNPSMAPAQRGDWAYAGFKGGSEPGVLNTSWLLRDEAGAWHVLSASWNDPAAALDQQRFELLMQRALSLANPADE